MLKFNRVRIRDIAYPALALNLLGVKKYKKEAINKLISLCNKMGGWPEKLNNELPSLVPTYHALSSLQKLGKRVDEKHYIWLSTLQKSNYLCSFEPTEPESNIGASCLVLYLSNYSRNPNAPWIRQLAKKIKEELPKIFNKMYSNDKSWISYDNNSTFTIYGYGHALLALNYRGENFFNLNVQKFMTSINQKTFDDIQLNSIPAILELSIALRSIKLNFDPFYYFNITTDRITQSVKSALESQRSLLVEKEKELKLRSAIIDELDKNIIRQRHEIPKIVISELFSSLKIKLNIVFLAIFYYSVLLAVFSIPLYLFIKQITSKTFSPINFYLIVIAIIPLIVELTRFYIRRRKILKGK